MMGNASSLVAMYTANSVPNAIFFLENKSVATTEKPHCGTMPTAVPISGANPPLSALPVLPDVLYSTSSIIMFIASRNGSIMSVSINASKRTSPILNPAVFAL